MTELAALEAALQRLEERETPVDELRQISCATG